MGLPRTKITFTSPETTPVRAERGVLAVIVADETKTFNYKTYTSLVEVDSADYTETNYADIARAFLANPNKVIVIRIDEDGVIGDATAILDNLGYDWLCSNVSGLQSGIVTYVKTVNTEYRARKANCIVTGGSAADNEHVVSIANTTVTKKSAGATTAIANYLPRIAGVLAACPLDRSVTGLALDDLEACSTVSNIDTSIDAGNLCLYLDDGQIKIARGVNTLQTISAGKIADMKKIAVVEAMNILQFDVITLFKGRYLGKVKNDSDHQALFVSDIISLLAQLAQESVIDDQSGYTVEIDVAAMRQAWAGIGVDVSNLTDAQVKIKTFGSTIFVIIRNLKFLDAMEDFNMTIVLNP